MCVRPTTPSAISGRLLDVEPCALVVRAGERNRKPSNRTPRSGASHRIDFGMIGQEKDTAKAQPLMADEVAGSLVAQRCVGDSVDVVEAEAGPVVGDMRAPSSPSRSSRRRTIRGLSAPSVPS